MINPDQSFLSSPQPKKYFRMFFWLAVVFYTTFMTFICIKTKIYFSSNDALYYLSIADNLLDNGLFMDGTHTPDGPVITPQNGIVGLFVMLRTLSFSKHQVLLFMLALNYILVLGSIFPLIEISKKVGLTSKHLLVLMICIYLGHYRVFQWLFMAPVNDMIYYSGQLWLLYLFICIDKHFSDGIKFSHRPLIFQMSACVLISVLLIHFRLNAIFLPLSGLLAVLLVRRFKLLPFFTVLLVAMLLSLIGVLLLGDTYDFSLNTSKIKPFLSDFSNQLYIFFFKLLPISLFKDLQGTGNLVYVPFYLAMLIAFIQGIKDRNLHLLLILFVTIMTFAMTVLHGCITARYLLVVSVFMYMMVLRIKPLRSIGYLFIGAVLVNTLWMLPNTMRVSRSALTWEDIATMDVLQTDEIVMIAQKGRSCWYFTGIRPVYQHKYTWNDIVNAESICVVGDDTYIETHKKQLKELAGDHSYQIDMVHVPCGPPGKPRFLFYKALLAPEEISIDSKTEN